MTTTDARLLAALDVEHAGDLSGCTRDTLAALARLLGDATADADDSPSAWSARQLRVERDHVIAARRKLSATRVKLAGVELAGLIKTHDVTSVSGPGDADPPTWGTFDVGDDNVVSVASRLVAHFPAGTLGPVGLCVSIDDDYEPDLTMYAADTDRETADAIADDILDRALGEANPLRHRTLRAKAATSGVALSVEPTPTDTREELILPDDLWREVDLSVAAITSRRAALERAGLGTTRGLLLAGPPGTGKTNLTRVIAAELAGHCTVVFADAAALALSVRDLYDELEHLGSSVVVLEDIDLVVGHRKHAHSTLTLADFLSALDGARQRKDVLTIATTNDPQAIDPAAQRSARFDTIAAVPTPDATARAAILARYLRPLGLELNVASIAQHLGGITGADLREVVRRTVLEHGDDVTIDALADVARSGRWKAMADTGHYL